MNRGKRFESEKPNQLKVHCCFCFCRSWLLLKDADVVVDVLVDVSWH